MPNATRLGSSEQMLFDAPGAVGHELHVRCRDGQTSNEVKEVLTKRFWQGVKKTFHDALEGRPSDGNALPPAAADTPKAPSTPDAERPAAKSQEKRSQAPGRDSAR